LKRKIFSILFAVVLVCSFSLMTAVPVGAADPGGLELVAKGDCTAEWTTEKAKVGSYSAKLTLPTGTMPPGTKNAEIQIDVSGQGLTLAAMEWSYWTWTPPDMESYVPRVSFYADLNGDGVADKIVGGNINSAPTTEEWYQVTPELWKDYSGGFYVWKEDGTGFAFAVGADPWAKAVEMWGEAEIVRVDLGYDFCGTNGFITAYVDDLTINGVPYDLEAYQPGTEASGGVTGDTATLDATAAGLLVNISGAGSEASGTIGAFAFNGVPSTEIDKALVETQSKSALKYVDVKVTGLTQGDATITLNYTDDEVTARGIVEDTLRLYYWYNGKWVLSYNSSVDTGTNIITGTIPASRLTGTPIAGAGTAEVTGSFEVGAPPAVTVDLAPSSISPLVEDQATVGVTMAAGTGNLNNLDKLELKLYYDTTPSAVNWDEATQVDTQTCAIITWRKATGSFSIAPSASTTWELGTCTAPSDLSQTTGEFVFGFIPGKVAHEADGNTEVWQLIARAESSFGVGFGEDADGTAMDWYGEIILPAATVDWGVVKAGMGFAEGPPSEKPLGAPVTYISNGGYNQNVKSSATWTGAGTATLDPDGFCDTAGEFALRADDTGILASGQLVDATGVTIATDTITFEGGNVKSSYALWLRLASVFTQDTYSGTITYMVSPD